MYVGMYEYMCVYLIDYFFFFILWGFLGIIRVNEWIMSEKMNECDYLVGGEVFYEKYS